MVAISEPRPIPRGAPRQSFRTPAMRAASPFGTSVDLLGRVGSCSPVASRTRNSSYAISVPVFRDQSIFDPLRNDGKTMPFLEPVEYPSLDFGEEPHRSSFAQTTFNSVNVLCGLGLLSYPFALRCSGWSGVFVLICLTLATLYTASILGKCMQVRPHVRTLPDIGREAFGKPMEVFIGVIFFIELYLAGSVAYLVAEGDNLHKLYPSVSRPVFLVSFALIVLPSTWLRDLSVLSYLSAIGVLSSLFLMATIIYSAFSIGVGAASGTVVFKLSTFPQSVGLFLIGYGGHAVFPNIYSSMKNPKKYTSMLSVTYLIVFLVYTVTACVGYLVFGFNTDEEITLNLSNGPVADIAIWIVIANPLSKFALSLSPLVVQVETMIPVRYHSPTFARFSHAIIATLLTFLALGTAMVIPMFDRLLEFTGSLCTSTVSLTYPAVCYMKLCNHRMSRFEFRCCGLVAALGIILAIVGTATSIYGPLPFE